MSKVMELKKNIYIVYIFTVVLASVLINILLKLGTNLDYMSIDIYSIANISKENRVAVFGYLFIKRLKQLIIIFLLTKFINPNVLKYGITIGLIFVLGAYISVQTYCYGFLGILLLLGCIFPQYIIYISIIKYMCDVTSKNMVVKNKSVYYINITLLLTIGVVIEEIFLIFFWGQIQQYIVLGI